VSEFDRTQFLKYFRDREKKIITIRNTVPEFDFSSRKHSKPIKLGYIGRMSFPKDLDTLVNAWALFCESARTDELLLIKGDGPYRESIEALVKQLSVEDSVQFQPLDEYADAFYESIDILVLSSLFEGLPYVLLEGQSAGCYLISSDVGGCKEVLTDPTVGLLFDPGDVSGLLACYKSAVKKIQEGHTPPKGASFDRFIDDIVATYALK
jgi:glycosyltransferase involved in cell wall biosynthesis